MRRRTTAVIGGGCAGVLVTRELLRCTDDYVALIEPGTPGPGLAYGAAQPWHLLNSRAGAMSTEPDDSRHFVTWLQARGIAADVHSFLPRRTFGRYLFASLDAASCQAPGRLRLHGLRAAGLRPGSGGWAVRLEDGREVGADQVVLAVGGPRPDRPAAVPTALHHHPGYVGDPWAAGALDRVPPGPVLLLGTGLTAVDVALTFAAVGRPGPVTAVSRRGLLPSTHHPVADPPVTLRYARGLRELTRQLRDAAGRADWRSVVDGLVPHADAIWTGLDRTAQDRFLRHLSRYWDVSRHRMAPRVAADVRDLRDSGALTVRAGAPVRITAAGSELAAAFADGTTRRYAAVVNCAGPGRIPACASPLVSALLRDGSVRPGPHGLGLDTDAAGRLRDASGIAHHRLWAVGPLRRGSLLETTAVPQIRDQARDLANRLAGAALAVAA